MKKRKKKERKILLDSRDIKTKWQIEKNEEKITTGLKGYYY